MTSSQIFSYPVRTNSVNKLMSDFVYFQDTVRQKDQSIRKYEQEIDSLQFRNDQVRQV